MSTSKTKPGAAEKLAAVNEYLSGCGSSYAIATKYGVCHSSVQKWISQYRTFGDAGLQCRKGNQRYASAMKEAAVLEYKQGLLSEKEICEKYRLRSRTQLEAWLKLYNDHKEFRPPGGRRMSSEMISTVYEQRAAVVMHCLSHGNNYAQTAQKFSVTYQQVYAWTHKFRSAGLTGLLDRRSRQSADMHELLNKYLIEAHALRGQNRELELRLILCARLEFHRGERSLSGVRQEAEYRTIQELQQERRWPIRQLCAAVEVSRAGYYKWLNRTESAKQQEDQELAELIRAIYTQQHGIPGYRQMTIILKRRFGVTCNQKRVYRIMAVLGLQSVCRRKKRRHRKKPAPEQTAANLLNREFSSGSPNEKWLTDVTEFKYGMGAKAYLSAVLDLCGRNIVAFSFGRRNNNALVGETFQQALSAYPQAKPLLHSDRGCQYTSKEFQKTMRQAGISQSMSRAGKCIDNGPMEGFWAILKTEMYYPNHFDDYDSLEAAINEYMDFYNNRRYQKKLKCMTPAEFVRSRPK